jgi:Domain of unknown function (DUF6946)
MLYVPMKTADQWKALLADPERHWKEGYSAHALATRWQQSPGFPPEIAELLASNERTSAAIPLLAIPEHQVPLRGGSKASQTDLWVLARTPRGLLSIAIEGKGSESFGPTVGEWRSNATPGKVERWSALCRLLEVTEVREPAIRYQLFHRTASALLEARRFCAIGAAVIVHSFSATRESFGDFQQFVALMGARLSRPDELVSVPPREGIELHFGWAQEAGSR